MQKLADRSGEHPEDPINLHADAIEKERRESVRAKSESAEKRFGYHHQIFQR